jgi:hypothetical protein
MEANRLPLATPTEQPQPFYLPGKAGQYMDIVVANYRIDLHPRRT